MKRRAMLLIVALQLAVLLLVLGGAMLYASGARYRGSRWIQTAAQAEALAQMGIDDALVKLRHDWKFPLRSCSDFRYQQEVTDQGRLLGYYLVTLKSHWAEPPYSVISIESEGGVGEATAPVSRHFCRCLVDVSPHIRGTTDANPRLCRVLDWQEGGREFGRSAPPAPDLW